MFKMAFIICFLIIINKGVIGNLTSPFITLRNFLTSCENASFHMKKIMINQRNHVPKYNSNKAILNEKKNIFAMN